MSNLNSNPNPNPEPDPQPNPNLNPNPNPDPDPNPNPNPNPSPDPNQVLLACGEPGRRYALPNARVMIHQPVRGASPSKSSAKEALIQVGP